MTPAARDLLLALAQTKDGRTIRSDDILAAAELLAENLIELHDYKDMIEAKIARPKPDMEAMWRATQRSTRQEWCV
jgi:hypothetical protein